MREAGRSCRIDELIVTYFTWPFPPVRKQPSLAVLCICLQINALCYVASGAESFIDVCRPYPNSPRTPIDSTNLDLDAQQRLESFI